MKYALLGLFFVIQQGQAAEVTGRLFTSPAEREHLEYLRHNPEPPVLEQPVVHEAGHHRETVAVPEKQAGISIQGMLQRSDGRKGTVWVNGKPLQEGGSDSHVQVGILQPGDHHVPLTILGTGQYLQLKPGEVYDPETGAMTGHDVHVHKTVP